jgi:hypothetical protein
LAALEARLQASLPQPDLTKLALEELEQLERWSESWQGLSEEEIAAGMSEAEHALSEAIALKMWLQP